MKTIWKFQLPSPLCVIEMPAGATVIRVGRQGASICLWAIVETDNPMETRSFATVGTGHRIPPESRHLGTWDDGPFVWHLFEPERAAPA